MQLPTIHTNGTSKASLINDLCEASHKLADAHRALQQTAPHGRDYYHQGPEALKQATKEHLDRLEKLAQVKDEIDELAFSIDQIP